MADLNPRNMAAIRSGTASMAQMHAALADIVAAVNNLGRQTNAEPVGLTQAPVSHSSLDVKGGAGVLDIAITDNSPQTRGKSNFVDITDTSTGHTHTVALGPARNIRVPVGPGKFRVSSYGAYPTSAPSQAIHHDPVDTTAQTAPPMQQGRGSGTGGGGFGGRPYNTDTVPVR